MLLCDLDEDKTLPYRTRLRIGSFTDASTQVAVNEALKWCRATLARRWGWALGDCWLHVHFERSEDQAMFRLFCGAQPAGTKLPPGTVRRTRRKVVPGRRRTAA